MTDPEIIHIERTGYPSWYEEPKEICRCDVCGDYITEGETYYDIPDIGVCHEDCLIEMLKEYERCEYL